MRVILTTLIILNSANDYVKNHPRHLMEYPLLILLTTVFLLILISSYNLMTLFLAIIGFSLNIYVLTYYTIHLIILLVKQVLNIII